MPSTTIDRREGRTKTGKWAVLIIYELWEWGSKRKHEGFKITAALGNERDEQLFRPSCTQEYAMRIFDATWKELVSS